MSCLSPFATSLRSSCILFPYPPSLRSRRDIALAGSQLRRRSDEARQLAFHARGLEEDSQAELQLPATLLMCLLFSFIRLEVEAVNRQLK